MYNNLSSGKEARVKIMGLRLSQVFEIIIPHATFATTLQKESEN